MLISNFSIHLHSERFKSNTVTVILEWIISLSQIYYQQLLQNVSVCVVPDPEMTTVNTGNRTLQLSLLYNRQYRASIIQPGICGQPNHTIFFEFNYSTYLLNIVLVMS